MSPVISQTVFKPNPGTDMSKLMALVAESAAIWRKHGAEVSVWSVSSGEIGNMIFTARYDSYAAYGKCTDAVFAAPDYQAWTAKGVARGVSTWVRNNVVRQLAI